MKTLLTISILLISIACFGQRKQDATIGDPKDTQTITIAGRRPRFEPSTQGAKMDTVTQIVKYSDWDKATLIKIQKKIDAENIRHKQTVDPLLEMQHNVLMGMVQDEQIDSSAIIDSRNTDLGLELKIKRLRAEADANAKGINKNNQEMVKQLPVKP